MSASKRAAPDWEAVRREFPALTHCTYLDTATYGQLPRRAAEAAKEHFDRRDRTACTDFLSWFDDMDRLRGRLAELIHCQADDIGFAPNAATGLSWLLNGLTWRTGDEILTAEGEFPNNLYAAAGLQRFGVQAKFAPADQLAEHISVRTRLIVVSMVNYSTGYRIPLHPLAEEARRRDVLLAIDATQALGALTLDVESLRPAFVVADAYKWLLGPNGAGFCYLSPELRRQLSPSIIGWRTHKDWRQVNALHHGEAELPGKAEQYEGGMLPFPCLYAFEQSVQLLLELGPQTIERRVLELNRRSQDLLQRHGAQVLHEGGPILSARWPHNDVMRLKAYLAHNGIFVSARHGCLRVSAHFYNNDQDLELLDSALQRLK
jgi:selenocysteine lyase/cysteine desulfurase